MPRRPAIPMALYALAAVLVSERVTLRTGSGWFAGVGGMVLGISCVVLLAGAIVGSLRAWSCAGVLLVVCVSLAMGCVLASLTLASQAAFVDLARKEAISDCELRVVSEPARRDDAYRCRATMRCAGSTSGDVWLTLPQDVDLGTTLRCVGRFVANEDDEWGVVSRMQGVWGSVRVMRVMESRSPEGMAGLLVRFRSGVLAAIDPESSPQRAILAGSVCGSRRGFAQYELDEVFSRAGVSHLVAVSGSHMALFSSMMGIVLERLNMGRRGRTTLLLGSCALYVVFCGMPLSAVRAWIMTGVSMVATLAGRRSHALSGVALAGLCMALVEPTVSGQVGFLLSVCAVCGLCLFSAYATYAMGVMVGEHKLPRWVPRTVARRARRLGSALEESVAASLAAQLCTMPISVAAFGEVSLVGPVVNALVSIPFSLMVSIGLLVAVATPAPAVQAALLVPCDLCACVVLRVATVVSSVPHCVVNMASHGLAVSVVCCCLMVALLIFWPRVRRAPVVGALALAAGLTLFVTMRWRYFAPARLCVLDVGQGDSILVQDGPASVLVDAGPDDSVVAALQRNHVLHLDAVVITHLHADHYAGLEQLVGNVECDRVYVGGGVSKSMPDSLARTCEELTGGSVGELCYGDVLHVENYTLRMVWPHEGALGTQNADSVMLQVNYWAGERGLSALLTGDAEQRELGAVITSGDVGNIDVLKVGHHGSDVSLTPEEAEYLDPEVAVASAGKNNRYGHPSPECVRILGGEGSVFVCTKEVGDVQICPGKGGVEVTCQNGEVPDYDS